MEQLVNLLSPEEGMTFKAPKVEDMMCTLKTLQQEMEFQKMMNGGNMRNDYMSSGIWGTATPYEKVLDKELIEFTVARDSLQKELHTLEGEVQQLEETHKQKEELFVKTDFLCEETEQDCAKQIKQSKVYCDMLEQYKCEIQEFRLKLQKQRVKLENQLLDLIEQHKLLESMFNLKNLPDEIKRAKNTNNQLLSVEQAKMVQLCQLNEELEQVKKQEQLDSTTAETQEE